MHIPAYEEGSHYAGKITGIASGTRGDYWIANISVAGEFAPIFYAMFITPENDERNRQTLIDIGVPIAELELAPDLEYFGQFIEGNTVDFTVKHRVGTDGKPHTEIKYLNGPRVMRPKAAAQPTKAGAMAAFKAAHAGMAPSPASATLVSAPRGPAQPVGGPPPHAPVDDSDLPF